MAGPPGGRRRRGRHTDAKGTILPAQESWPCPGPRTQTMGSSSPIPRISNWDAEAADRPEDTGRNSPLSRSMSANGTDPKTTRERSCRPGPSIARCRARAVSAGATTERIPVVAGCLRHLELPPGSKSQQALSRPGSRRRRHPAQFRAMIEDGSRCCRSRYAGNVSLGAGGLPDDQQSRGRTGLQDRPGSQWQIPFANPAAAGFTKSAVQSVCHRILPHVAPVSHHMFGKR
jgi:hypothetical protein